MNADDENRLQELEIFCRSELLSIEPLHKKLQLIHQDAAKYSPFLHEVCKNKSVTLEMIECILDAFPEAANTRWTTAYPLHLACYNENCPNSVINLLVKKNPSALSHLCEILNGLPSGDYDGSDALGLPLHYYLSRPSNMDLGTVKMLVDAHPVALTTADDESGFTPILTLLSNPNICALHDIFQFLVQAEPASLRMADGYDRVPLHVACSKKIIDAEIVQLILDVWPESTSQQDNCERRPLHTLCGNVELDDVVSSKILAILIEASPAMAHHRDFDGDLPIHIAAGDPVSMQCKSPDFFKVLIGAYPESVRMGTELGFGLPIHGACSMGRLDTVKYLLELYPESIGARNNWGSLPIDQAADRLDGNEGAEIIKFLLMQDPGYASKATTAWRRLPLHLACSKRKLNLGVVRLLFDTHPEAIYAEDEDGHTPLHMTGWRATRSQNNSKVIDFLERQMAYALQAQDTIAMTTTPHGNGWLPLHYALHGDASLGAIKLLVKGNSAAVQVADHEGALPLHIACEFGTVDAAKFLLELDDSCLKVCDVNRNYPLHYACRGGNCGTVKYLLKHDQPVSERNIDDKLPFHLLCESEKVDRKGQEFIEAIWLLLLAQPDTVMNSNW